MNKVTNVWSLEWMQEENKYFAIMARPQDWGNPRWKYYKFTLIDHDAGYENECHCWLDTSYKKPEGTPGELFGYSTFRVVS